MLYNYDFRKQLEIYTVGFLIIISLIYGGFRAYPLVAGPKIIIFSPQDGDVVASSTFQISGQVFRAKNITLQGRPISIDDNGKFNEVLVSYTPYTFISITANDNYGSNITKTLRVIPK